MQHVTVQLRLKLLATTSSTLRRMLRSGALEGVKIGQMWLIELDALEAYLKRVESTSDRRCRTEV